MAGLSLDMGDIEAPTESTPLKGNDLDEDDEPLGSIPENTTKEKIVAAAAVVGAGTNIAAMVMEGGIATKVSGTIGTLLAPYSALQQQKITETQAMKETCERLDEEVTNLKVENDRLNASVGELQTSVESLQDIEKTLEEIRKLEGASLDQLEEQLKETEEIYDSMQENLKSNILQNLISVVLNCDADGDMSLGDEEIDAMIHKIQGMYGVDVDDEKAKKRIVDAGRSLNAVMELVRDLFDEDIAEEERIFKVVEE
mmetsp:Transcript_18615/g.40508  ORF Transcript_18615/g.40508 Transcript_18615/m.40508 type:complete len:256 (+) Transcript_18615:43-810(+)